MPGWAGKFVADSVKKNQKEIDKLHAEGKISDDVYQEATVGNAQTYEYAKAREERKKKEGIGGAFKSVGNLILGTAAGALTGGPTGAIAGFTGAAAAEKVKGQAAQVKALQKRADDRAVGQIKDVIPGFNSANNMSFLSNIVGGVGDALVKFTNTGVGQAATGILGQYVASLGSKQQQGPTQEQLLASLLGTATGNPAIAQAYQETLAQQATFGGSGISVNIPGVGNAGTGWWADNKMWALPVFIGGGILALVLLVMSIFKPKRRR